LILPPKYIEREGTCDRKDNNKANCKEDKSKIPHCNNGFKDINEKFLNIMQTIIKQEKIPKEQVINLYNFPDNKMFDNIHPDTYGYALIAEEVKFKIENSFSIMNIDGNSHIVPRY